MLCFVCGLAREIFWFFDVIVAVFEAMLGNYGQANSTRTRFPGIFSEIACFFSGLVLVPLWFVLLGIGLANCQSISTLNGQFADAVAEAAFNLEDAVADQKLAQMAEEQAVKREAKEASLNSRNPQYNLITRDIFERLLVITGESEPQSHREVFEPTDGGYGHN